MQKEKKLALNNSLRYKDCSTPKPSHNTSRFPSFQNVQPGDYQITICHGIVRRFLLSFFHYNDCDVI